MRPLFAVLTVAGTFLTGGVLAASPAGAATQPATATATAAHAATTQRAGTAAPADATSGPTVTEQQGYQPVPTLLDGISCTSTTQCVAVGQAGTHPVIVTTSDGGSVWTSVALPSESESLGLNGVSCVATGHCVAVGSESAGSVIYYSTDAGSTWAQGNVPEGVTWLRGVSCVSATACAAVGQGAGLEAAILTTADGGVTWTPKVLTGNETSLGMNGVSCYRSTTDCVAVGSESGGAVLAHPNFTGKGSWTVELAPSGVTALNDISCVSTSDCVAVGQGQGDGAALIHLVGNSWTSVLLSTGNAASLGMNGVSCTVTGCVAVGAASGESVILGATSTGSSWTVLSGPTPSTTALDAASCVGAFCAVSGNATPAAATVLVGTEGGTTWTPQVSAVARSGVDGISEVSCASANDCFAVGAAQFLATTDGGGSWAVSAPAPGTTYRDLSCPSPSTCLDFLGGTPTVQVTTNGGAAWATHAVTNGGVVTALSCPTSNTCYAAGSEAGAPGAPVVFSTTTTADTWSAHTLPSGITGIEGLDCPSATTCFGIAGTSSGTYEIVTTSDSGADWSVQNLPAGVAPPTNLSCPSTSACFAVSYLYDEVYATTDGGGTWVSRNPTSWPSHYFTGFDCASATTCVAVGSSGGQGLMLVTEDGGSSWTSADLPEGTSSVSGVSCPTATACEAVGTNSAGGGMVLRVGLGSAPGTPGDVTATAGVSSATVSWSAPENGGSPSSFVVQASPGTRTVTVGGSATSATVGGLTPGTAYRFTVTASNQWGSSSPSDPSDEVVPTAVAPQGTQSGSGNDPSATVTAPAGATGASLTVKAAATGTGTVTVASYAADPVAGFRAGTSFFDVSAAPGSSFGALQFSVCGLATGQGVSWWDPAAQAWRAVSDQTPVDAAGCVTVTVTAGSSPSLADMGGTVFATTQATAGGYWEVASDGGLFAFGDAGFYGSMGGKPLAAPIVGMTATPTGRGYWEVASDGGLFAFGDAGFYGSMGGKPLNRAIVAMASTPDGKGYWEVAADGGLFAFGDAGFYGSMGGRPLAAPIVGIAPTPDGKGYWEVASDGGLFAFGDAGFYGSMGGKPLNQPIVAMAATPDGKGYWEVAADGGLFAFGDAQYYGSMGGKPLNEPIVGMTATPDGAGYWEVASDGGLFSFGDAAFTGSMGGRPLARPVVGMASVR